MNEQELYEALFGKCKDSTISLITLPDRQIKHYPVDELARFSSDAVRLGAITNTYISIWPRRNNIPGGVRGGSDDTVYATYLFADYDVAAPAHKAENLPPTKESVLEHLKGLEKPPTVIVDTGYGLDPFWLFAEPVPLKDETNRNRAVAILTGYGKYLKQRCKEYGWELDNVFDPARMLRAPGSNNFKLNTSVPCRIFWESGIFYVLEDFASYYDVPVTKHNEPFTADERTVGSAERIMEGCRAVQKKMRDDPEDVSEQLWHAICTNAVLTPDGQDKFHEWSSPYSNYSYEETEYKIQCSIAAKKPCTCAYFRDGLGFSCPEDGCGVKAPVVLALFSKEEQVRNLLSAEKLTPEDILNEYTLKLMAYAKEHYPADYSRFKLRVKKVGLGLRDFERAVRSEAEKYTVLPFDIIPSKVELDGIELGVATVPTGYDIFMEGGVQAIGYEDTGPVNRLLCPNPLVITKRLENIDSGLEKVELAFYRNGKWKRLIAPRSGVFSKTVIMRYADSGLPVTTDNAEGVVRYLSDYEVVNTSVIPFTRSISRIGWMGKEFYPCAVHSEIAYEDENGDKDDIVQGICERGDYDIWLETAERLRKTPFARAVLSASFASPLLELLQNRVILLHLWHSSRSGKTAALKFALSVWGDPLKLMGNFNSTAVGLERRAGTLKHLPLGLDELQVLNEKRLSPAMIVYSLGNGYGKTRGNKNGGLQDVPTWRNCIISTGEQPLSSENSMDGVNSRVLEMYGAPIEDTELGRSVHQISENNYGFAGKRYIEYLICEVLPQKEKLKADYTNLREQLKAHFEMLDLGDAGTHLDNISVLSLADRYSSESIFGVSAEEAVREAVQLGLALLQNAKSLEKEDTVERAWDYVINWIAANKKRFCQDAIPCYGNIEPERVFIISSELNRALEEGGFSYTKSIKGFRERGHIATYTDSKGVQRSQRQKYIQGKNVRAICANIIVKQTYPVEEDFLNATGQPTQPLPNQHTA